MIFVMLCIEFNCSMIMISLKQCGLKILIELFTILFHTFRLGEFLGFLETVEDLQKKLQREDLTSEEYKDLQAQFQVRFACDLNNMSQILNIK